MQRCDFFRTGSGGNSVTMSTATSTFSSVGKLCKSFKHITGIQDESLCISGCDCCNLDQRNLRVALRPLQPLEQLAPGRPGFKGKDFKTENLKPFKPPLENPDAILFQCCKSRSATRIASKLGAGWTPLSTRAVDRSCSGFDLKIIANQVG